MMLEFMDYNNAFFYFYSLFSDYDQIQRRGLSIETRGVNRITQVLYLRMCDLHHWLCLHLFCNLWDPEIFVNSFINSFWLLFSFALLFISCSFVQCPIQSCVTSWKTTGLQLSFCVFLLRNANIPIANFLTLFYLPPYLTLKSHLCPMFILSSFDFFFQVFLCV